MRKSSLILVLLLSTLVNVQSLFSQSIPDSTIKKIDGLFSRWNNNTPGCSIGIIRNDSLIYAKGYGQANLEYGIANAPTTIFHMASISKQFTAWSILLLERQGKLKLDDDIRKYLSWFPVMKKKISIKQLLNHTSGIRDQWQLLAIAGTRLDDVITQDQIIKILSRQKELNFEPGEKYSYSNSGFTMLAEIVKSVTGQTLRKFTDSAIFKPLGMKNTHFHDDYTEIEKNRAYSYQRENLIQFKNSVLSYSNAGATSLFTNINDLSKWVMNFYLMKSGDQRLIDTLTTRGKLNNGKLLNYACGIVVDSVLGFKNFSHGGADAGYRTYISIFPENKMGFLVFSNLGEVNTGDLAEKLAQLFISDKNPKPAAIELPDSTKILIKDSLAVHPFLGDYFGEDGLPCTILIKNNKLFYQINEESNPLEKRLDSFYNIVGNKDIQFNFSIRAKNTNLEIITPGETYLLKKYLKKSPPKDTELLNYTGEYYCEELDCKYGIVLKDHQLVLTNNKYNDAKLVWINNEHLTCENWWINHLQLQRNANNQIIGFEVNSGRIKHLKFIKLANSK